MRLRYLVALLFLPLPSVAGQTAGHVWRISERPSISIGSPDTEGPELFGAITGAVRLTAGTVVVADGKNLELRYFAANGKYLKTAGRRGAGPGEFRLIASTQRCAGDSVFVYDPARYRVSIFGPDAVFARSFDVREWSPDGLPPYDFWCHPAGILAFIHRSNEPPRGEGPVRPNVRVSIIVRRDSSISLGSFPATERYFKSGSVFPRHLGKETTVVPSSNAVYVGTGDTFDILKYSLRGERLAVVREARSPIPVTNNQVTTYIKETIANTPRNVNTSGFDRWFHEIEFPKAYPAHGKLLVDDSDNLWVEEYVIPGSAQREWTIFDPSGNRIAKVAVPKQFRLFQAGRDYVLGVWRDSVDVDYLRVYPLVK